jgi:predicted DNA-binding transcriptional regulator AlpA
MDAMTVSEIAALLGITRQGVDYIARTDASFPAPVVASPRLRVWERADIEKWAKQAGRLK